jgi:hypothetical protein
MDKGAYLVKFSRAARWYLAEPEAAAVIADYRELVERPEAGSDPAAGIGAPWRAARLLAVPKAYRRWLAAFILMALCLLVPESLLLRASFSASPDRLLALLLAAGLAASLLWFRLPPWEKRGPLPGGLRPVLAAVLVMLLLAAAVLWGMAAGAWGGAAARRTLVLTGTLAAAAGLWGLVQARLTDRRWRAVYVLGLTALAVCVLVLFQLVRMDRSASGWWHGLAVRCGLLAGLGLCGTGVSLC